MTTPDGYISKQELADVLAKYDTWMSESLVKMFSLPTPVKKQMMEIVLHIPVKNMDAMGDTYSMGVDKLNDIFYGKGIGDELDNKYLISTVEINDV